MVMPNNLKMIFCSRWYGRSTRLPSKIVRRLRFWLVTMEETSPEDRPVRAILGTKRMSVRKLAARRM